MTFGRLIIMEDLRPLFISIIQLWNGIVFGEETGLTPNRETKQ